MIGTDMASGKMTTGLELYSYLKNKNINGNSLEEKKKIANETYD